MTKNRIVKYVTNAALLAVLAAAGIGAYQLGTSNPEKQDQEKTDFVEMEMDTEEESMIDVGTDQVEADMDNTSGNDLAGETLTKDNSNEDRTLPKESNMEKIEEPLEEKEAADSTENSSTEDTETAAGAVAAPALSFSEETQMEWPVNGNILLDYNMDQTVYFPTLDQYKLNPAIAVQAVEGAPVLASVPGTVYSIEENVQTGTTVTMELGSGYQAIYGQLKDLAVKEGETVEKGTVIGYVALPTKYYSEEGSNLYFAMKKNGEPVDPIAYLPE